MVTGKVLGAIALLGLLQGCANLGSIYRPIAVEGKAVTIDGYQTPVFSSVINIAQDWRDPNEKKVDRTVVCPSPPVDAISTHSVGSALTNNFSSGASKDSLQFSLADVMAAASIGLRTNSTTLLSYNSAWNCLAYMGGATTDPKFMELARRNQNITLGILAIEQVTGVTKAAQAALGGTASGSTGADDVTAFTTNLDNARKDQNGALEKADQQNLALQGEETKLATLEKTLESKRKALTALPAAATAEQKEEAEAAVVSATSERDAGRKSVESAKLAVTAARRDVERASLSVRTAEDALSQAQMRVKAAASASATLTESGGPQGAAMKEVANAVVTIVQAVLLESGRGESCNTLYEDFSKAPEKYNTVAGQKLMDFCLEQRRSNNTAQEELIKRLPTNSFPFPLPRSGATPTPAPTPAPAAAPAPAPAPK